MIHGALATILSVAMRPLRSCLLVSALALVDCGGDSQARPEPGSHPSDSGNFGVAGNGDGSGTGGGGAVGRAESEPSFAAGGLGGQPSPGIAGAGAGSGAPAYDPTQAAGSGGVSPQSAGNGPSAGAGGTSAGRDDGADAAGTGAGGSAGAPASAGQGGGGDFPALKITSDTKSIEFTPVLVAAEEFYPGKATVSSGGIVSLLSDPSVDLGSNAETQTLRQSVMYPNLRVIFTVTETFYRIVANRSAGIETLADLAGKRIASINNTSAAYFISKYLGTVNVTNYTIVTGSICMAAPCGQGTLPGLVERGNADAIALWEPSTELGREILGQNAVVFQDRALYREIVNLHSTTEKLADPVKRRGIVEFVRSLAKAQERFRTSPESVWPRIVSAIGIEQPVLEAVWEDEQFLGTLVPDILDVLEEEEPWVAAQSRRTPRTRAELATIVDDSILKEALGVP